MFLRLSSVYLKMQSFVRPKALLFSTCSTGQSSGFCWMVLEVPGIRFHTFPPPYLLVLAPLLLRWRGRRNKIDKLLIGFDVFTYLSMGGWWCSSSLVWTQSGGMPFWWCFSAKQLPQMLVICCNIWLQMNPTGCFAPHSFNGSACLATVIPNQTVDPRLIDLQVYGKLFSAFLGTKNHGVVRGRGVAPLCLTTLYIVLSP